MRAKELKQMLNKLPDNTEIIIRAQVHQDDNIKHSEFVQISSANAKISNLDNLLILNPVKTLRVSKWVPKDNELVDCVSCKHYSSLISCRSRDRDCTTCFANCSCSKCNPSNPTIKCTFAERPQWESV